MKRRLSMHFFASVLFIIVVSLVAVWAGFAPKALYANTSCQGTSQNYVGTGDDHAVAVVAVSVDLNSRQPVLCSGSNPDSASAVWTTIVSETNCGWSQAGYFVRPGLAIKVYGEYNKQSCTVFQSPDYMLVVWGTGQNGVHTYQVKYNANQHSNYNHVL